MKPPKNLPPLESPFYVFGEPALFQYSLVALCWAAALFTGWLAYERLGDDDTLWGLNVLILMLCVAFLASALNPRIWRRWVRLAADSKGLYLPCDHNLIQVGGCHHFIPWNDVGETSIVTVGKDKREYQALVLKLRVGDDVWLKITRNRSKALEALQTPKDQRGYRAFPLGNHGHEPRATRAALERVRSAANAPTASSAP